MELILYAQSIARMCDSTTNTRGDTTFYVLNLKDALQLSHKAVMLITEIIEAIEDHIEEKRPKYVAALAAVLAGEEVADIAEIEDETFEELHEKSVASVLEINWMEVCRLVTEAWNMPVVSREIARIIMEMYQVDLYAIYPLYGV